MLHNLSFSPCTGSRFAARIKFKTLMLAYRTATGSAPSYFHSLITIYIPSRSLRSESNASWYHHREAQNHSPERFHSPFLAGGMNFPPLSGMLDPCQFSSDTWKLISSRHHFTFWLEFAMNNAYNFVLQALPVSVSPLYNVSLIVCCS